jgi:acetyl esterase/lipase
MNPIPSSQPSWTTELPQPLTFAYKTLPWTSLHADVYVPTKLQPVQRVPVVLFLHGGGWITGSRDQIPAIYLHEFLSRGFLFISIDYRLLPESDFLTEQLEDVRDVETWLREILPIELKQILEISLDVDKIVSLGVSAGAHLSLLLVCHTSKFSIIFDKFWRYCCRPRRSSHVISIMFPMTKLIECKAEHMEEVSSCDHIHVWAYKPD